MVEIVQVRRYDEYDKKGANNAGTSLSKPVFSSIRNARCIKNITRWSSRISSGASFHCRGRRCNFLTLLWTSVGLMSLIESNIMVSSESSMILPDRRSSMNGTYLEDSKLSGRWVRSMRKTRSFRRMFRCRDTRIRRSRKSDFVATSTASHKTIAGSKSWFAIATLRSSTRNVRNWIFNVLTK